MSKEKVYYNNIECVVVAQLPNNESVIEFVTGLYEEPGFHQDGHTWQGSVEPIEQRLIVDNKYLSNKVLTADDGLAEYNRIIKEANTKAKEIIRNANDQARQDLVAIQQQAKAIKLDISSLEKASPHISTAKKFINGDYKFVVRLNKICSIDEMKDQIKRDCDYSDSSLTYNNLFLKISENCISYSGYNAYKLFETLEKAKEHLCTTYKQFAIAKQYAIDYYKEIVKWNLDFEGMEDYKKACVEKFEKQSQDSINSHKKSIELIKDSLKKALNP